MTVNEQLKSLTLEMRANSERWFPQLHDGHLDLAVFYGLGLAGEVGEVANIVKKMVRQAGEGDVALYAGAGEELADVFTYLMLLCDELGVDIVAEYQRKRDINATRWGGKAV